MLLPAISQPVFDVTLFLLTILSFFLFLFNPNKYRIRVNKSSIALGLLLILVIFSFIKNNYFYYSFDSPTGVSRIKLSFLGLITVVLTFLNFLIISSLPIRDKDKIGFIFYSVLAGGISALVTLIFWFSETGGEFKRYNYFPPLSESQGIHQYYMILTLLFSIVLLVNKSKISYFKYIIVCICSVMAFFSMTTIMVREGWIIFLITLIISWYKLSQSSKLSRLIKGTVLVTIFFTSILFILNSLNLLEDIYSSTDDGGGESTVIRIAMIENSLKLILGNPILGVGYGNFSLFVSLFVNLSGGNFIEVNSPHNAIILITSELGFLGLFILVYLSWAILIDLNSVYKKSQNKFNVTFIGIFSVFFFLVSLDQIISNSLLVPPPGERSSVQLSFLMWMTISILIAKPPLTDGNRK